MIRVAQVRAQAKINLFLRILAREASGYHGLETLFARLELADELTVRVGVAGRSVECRGADVGPAESNLAYRAAVSYADATGWPAGFAIEIEKRIPVGGGLGGGSADAGGVLRALNALAPSPLGAPELLSIAGRLGADVPFVTTDAPWALAWGRGDRLLALPSLPAREVGLVCFPFGISSAAAFGWVADSRHGDRPGGAPSRLDLMELRSWDGAMTLLGNDFEEEVARRHPLIARVLEGIRARGDTGQLTGSGSTVVIFTRGAGSPDAAPLPDGASLIRTRTAISVEDVRVIG